MTISATHLDAIAQNRIKAFNKDEARNFVEHAIADPECHITESMRDWAIDFYERDKDGFKQYVAEAPLPLESLKNIPGYDAWFNGVTGQPFPEPEQSILQGENKNLVVFDECAEITEEAWEDINERVKSQSKYTNGEADKYYDADGKETRRRI